MEIQMPKAENAQDAIGSQENALIFVRGVS